MFSSDYSQNSAYKYIYLLKYMYIYIHKLTFRIVLSLRINRNLYFIDRLLYFKSLRLGHL